jgi:hypothetical protein
MYKQKNGKSRSQHKQRTKEKKKASCILKISKSFKGINFIAQIKKTD